MSPLRYSIQYSVSAFRVSWVCLFLLIWNYWTSMDVFYFKKGCICKIYQHLTPQSAINCRIWQNAVYHNRAESGYRRIKLKYSESDQYKSLTYHCFLSFIDNCMLYCSYLDSSHCSDRTPYAVTSPYVYSTGAQKCAFVGRLCSIKG